MSAEDLRRLLMLAALLELYFFFLQRTALDWERAEQFPPGTRALVLPAWYPVGWIPIVAKWVLAIAAGYAGGWAPSIAILVSFWLASTVAPVPYTNYLPILRHRASQLPSEAAQDLLRSLGRFAVSTSPSGIPIWSIAGLLFPLLGTLALALTTPASPLVLLGAFFANLGYLLLACALLAGSFRAFGLRSRRTTLLGAVATFAVGFVATNIGFGALGA